MNDLVLSMFDESAVACLPWAEAGYECWAVDTAHRRERVREFRSGGLIRCVPADARRFRPPCQRRYAAAFAWPPCTHLSISGARWFKGKGLFPLADSIELVAHGREIMEATGAPYLIEQPMSTLSTYWRKPDYRFNPCDYALYRGDPDADAYTKQTWLWTGGGFVMPECQGVEPVDGSRMHRLPPSKDRASLRAATPEGFAWAVFQANAEKVSA